MDAYIHTYIPTYYLGHRKCCDSGSLEGQSSQESNWTSYTNCGDSLSAQSSQEELPEAMMEARGSQEYANSHYLMQLSTLIDKHKPQQYK